MTLDQFNTLVTLLPDIENVITGKGGALIRPDYSGAPANKSEKSPPDLSVDVSPTKNFEPTSDEDEGDGG